MTPRMPLARWAHGGTQVAATRLRLQLLDRMELSCGGASVPIPDPSQRLVAFLALRSRPQHRAVVAGTLWMDVTDDRAAANLRTALWRVRKLAPELVVTDGPYLAIGDDVVIDIAEIQAEARWLITERDEGEEPHTTAEELALELLPDWYDDWVLIEHERLRQMRLHGLEALCRRLIALGRHAEAIEAGLLAMEIEPLRESTQRALLAAHLAEGNLFEAVRQYDTYAALVHEQFGVEPSDELRALVAPCR